MSRLVRLFRTSIGSKLLMSVSGLVLLGFLIGHLLGNMKVFQGQEALNAYGAWMHGHPLLWVIRLFLLSILLLHVLIGLRLARENRRGRPHRYAVPCAAQTGFAERHLVLSGLLVLAFIVYHVLHLTVGVLDRTRADLVDAQGHVDVYARVVLGFQDPWICASYVLALVLLGLHLQHAIRSLFQTLGFRHESYQALIAGVSAILPSLLVVGFGSIPVCVWLEVIPPPGTSQP
jgi:succinate dehydrogenase / fumarate reductase cytochrome b subunit